MKTTYLMSMTFLAFICACSSEFRGGEEKKSDIVADEMGSAFGPIDGIYSATDAACSFSLDEVKEAIDDAISFEISNDTAVFSLLYAGCSYEMTFDLAYGTPNQVTFSNVRISYPNSCDEPAGSLKFVMDEISGMTTYTYEKFDSLLKLTRGADCSVSLKTN